MRAWLFFICAMIFAMILVGGATRLTDSGLSITEWQPIVGILPPLTEDAWREAFRLYQKIPEYAVVNKGMSLDEFKFIYWWEWAHRFLGRMIGLVFLLPFLYFIARGRISRRLAPKLVIMFVLGGLQGALGWYMVRSGLVDRVDVSQYRLAAHLCAAIFIFGYIFWVAIRMGRRHSADNVSGPVTALSAAFLTLAIFVQIALGAFVAGLDAGQGYNTWPEMDGTLIPDGLAAMTPWYLNLFENALTVQFNHRMFAYALVIYASLHAVLVARIGGKEDGIAMSAALLACAVWLQAALGVMTLLTRVPVSLGLAHQGMAVIVFALSLFHLSRLLPVPARDPR